MDRSNLVGQNLGGRYRIDELIGQGGMAAVYKAYDPNLQRVVAVKTIKDDKSADPKFVSRFESEATAVAQLRHENIVQVYDFSHEDGFYYMVQEFVPGETLRDHLRRLSRSDRKMPVEEAIRYTVDILKAVGYAHRRGMIHRDIKPANIMLDVHGRAVLMDFGIVKITGSTEHTVAGAVMGTAIYMPPELIRGEVPDARADIYSLGVTLYEMLSGQPPFEADSAMSLLMMHLQEPVPDLQKMRPDLPQPLVDVVRRALAKDRQDRYASAADMAAALEQVPPQIDPDLAIHMQATELNAPLTPGPTQEEPLPQDLARDSARAAGRDSAPDSGWVSGTLAETPATDRQPAPRQAAPAPQAAAGWQSAPLRTTAPPATPPLPDAAPAARPAGSRFGPRRLWLGAAALLGAVVLGLGLALLLGGGKGTDAGAAAVPTASATVPLAAVEDTPLPAVAATAVATAVPLPTATPPSLPAGAQATILSVELDAEGHYLAQFKAPWLDQAAPGGTLHFFFDTVPPEQAGSPATGTWLSHAGPSPFAGYTAADRPENAGQLCVLVAGADDTVLPASGNCAPLPDVVTVTVQEDQACFFGPGDDYPVIAQLQSGDVTLVHGLSANELWWNVANPQGPSQACWLYTVTTTVSGDVGTLTLVEAPPPGAEPEQLAVEITGISLDDQEQYVVDFLADGFTPVYPGTHIHFYFDTFSAADVGIGGEANRRAYGGAPPFSGYTAADRPENATQLCAIVANPEHSVIAGSGNCFPLPDLPSVEITGVRLDGEGNYVVDFVPHEFEPAYPGTHIHFYFNTFSPEDVGIGGEANRRAHGAPSPFSGYTAAERPEGATELCAIVANPNHTVVLNSGNCYHLPDVLEVQITHITVDAEGRYVVDYVAYGFEPEWPGTHVHFYFDTVSPEELGQQGQSTNYSHGGHSPYTGYSTADRPEGATQLCAIVATEQNEHLPGSGNCFPLPDVAQPSP